MNELTELRFNENQILLQNNIVRSPILPRVASELERDIVIKGNCLVEGAMYARHLQIEQGPIRVRGPVFTQMEVHINGDATGEIVFEKSVGSAGSLVSQAPGCRPQFLADVNARQVRLRNAFVAASLFADEVLLEDCVVIGGVFATRGLELRNCVVGTFHSPSVHVSENIYLLLPSAFSREPVSALPGSDMFSLTLADLGAMIRGTPHLPQTGKIRIDLEKDQQRTYLNDNGSQQTVRSYSVAGKVLAADMIDVERLQNHFLLSAAALGGQLLQAYDPGPGANGEALPLTASRVGDFLFNVLHGRIAAPLLDGTFSLGSFAGAG